MPDHFINDIYYYALETNARAIVLYGGRDSGKSYFVGGQYIPIKMMQEPYFRGAAIRKTYASLKDSVFTEILDGIEVFGVSNQFSSTKSPLEISHANGNKLLFRGLDNPTKIKSLKGLNVIWVEEAEDLTEQEFWDLMIILRGEGHQRLILTFNPIDEDHFTNAMLVESEATKVLETFDDGDKKVWIKTITNIISGKEVKFDVLVVRSTYDDNAFIPPIRKAVIEQLKETDPFLYDVYRKGKYGTKGGRILTNVKLMDMQEKGLGFKNFDNKGYAQDFGFNHANAILSVAEKDNDLYVFDEIYEHEKDTSEHIETANSKQLDKKLSMICDCAEPDRIKMWQKAGYKAIGVRKYQGSVNAQIDRLKQYNNIYIDVSCTNTWKEAKSWNWKQDKRGKFTDEPVNVFDDAMAALRYATDLFSKNNKLKTLDKNQFGL